MHVIIISSRVSRVWSNFKSCLKHSKWKLDILPYQLLGCNKIFLFCFLVMLELFLQITYHQWNSIPSYSHYSILLDMIFTLLSRKLRKSTVPHWLRLDAMALIIAPCNYHPIYIIYKSWNLVFIVVILMLSQISVAFQSTLVHFNYKIY